MPQDYRNLMVWQKAIELTVLIYMLTRVFPRDEMYGLTSQMRRASVSVASNIAEDRGRLNPAEFRQFLGVAQGSMYELQTQLLVAKKLGICQGARLEEAESLCNEISRMLNSLIQTITASEKRKKVLAGS
jgi:four helix bundle protein